MATVPKCKFCGVREWGHTCYKPAASNEHLTVERGSRVGQGPYRSQVASPGPTVSTKQRWSQEAYNAYMREYMRAYRQRHGDNG